MKKILFSTNSQKKRETRRPTGDLIDVFRIIK